MSTAERLGLHYAVMVAMIASLGALVWWLNTDAGGPWSWKTIATIFVPPILLGTLLLVGYRTRRQATGLLHHLASVGVLGLVCLLFVLAVLYVPVGLLGELMDMDT